MKPTKIYEVNLQTLARTPLKQDDFESVCTFEDGYAAFISRWFEKLNEESGQLLVFMNGATFGGDNLDVLSYLIQEVRQQMKSRPESWNVSLGWQLEPPHNSREIMSAVNKRQLSELLDKVDAAISQAKAKGTFVRFNFWGGGG